MPNLLALSGAQPSKQTRFAPIYTGRWSSGIWTNRSPLRDANTTRLVEKFYGPSGDALIAGTNVEITNRLTLARRPGNVIFDNSGWNSVDSFYEFHTFEGLPNNLPLSEHIHIMVDEAEQLLNLVYTHQPELIFDKNTGAGQTFMQSVGNSLYFGDGVDNKKWLYPTFSWQSLGNWNQTTTPLWSTFLVDPNNNIQQLTTQGTGGVDQPSWSTQVPDAGNEFQGGVTTDGSAQWTNRGPWIENWGIVAPTQTLIPQIGTGGVAWQATTRYSLPGVVIDSNGNLQQVTTRGISGATAPTWATGVNQTTPDGTVIWTMIQTAASLPWVGHTAYSDGVFVTGNSCLFQGSKGNHAFTSGTLTAGVYPATGGNGKVTLTYPAGSPAASSTDGNIYTVQAPTNSQPVIWYVVDGAGETTSEPVPFPSYATNYQMAMTGSIQINVPGQYSVSIAHLDGCLLGIGGSAVIVSGIINDPLNHTISAVNGYPLACGTNLRQDNIVTDTAIINFPTTGAYPIEIDYAYANNGTAGAYFSFFVNGQTPTPPPPESGSSQPIWPAWSTQYAPGYPSVAEQSSNQYTWNNLGPLGDFVWQANVTFTLPDTTIIDPNGNTEAPYRTGTSGTTQPVFATGINQLTPDIPNLIWINEGIVEQPPTGTLTTSNGGWQYAIALVNSLDETVSNCGPLSASTGNFIGISGIVLPPGSGLPTDLSQIDPQADAVAIFRTTDGESTPFLIPGNYESGSPAMSSLFPIWTLSLHDYLTSGYTDTATDEQLNNLIEGPIAGQNTPPAAGAINLTFHLNRLFFSIGNTVYWTAGPDTPIGNGVNGVPPLNYDTFPSKVIRIMPVAIGALVFTVNGIWLIQGSGTTSSPIQGGIPYLPTFGVLSYNAVAYNGSLLGFFTTENQFIIIDPSVGTIDAGFPLGNLFRLRDGNPGTTWNPANVYETYHTEGEDSAFYVADGINGWYRLMTTPSPETGYTWSPFALINQAATSPYVAGCKCVQSVEIEPGIHRLLIGPTGTGPILNRSLDVFTDSGNTYPANATIGSAVLAQPGQVAGIVFVATDSVKIGTPLTIGMLLDEALPYYQGPIEILKSWEDDPINILPASTSIIGQRFYMDELHEKAAVCRHCQIQILWSETDSIQNELLTLTLYGGFIPEN